MTGIGCILYAQCWACQFDQHFPQPTAHTWMDEDDAQAAGVAYDVALLTLSHPCPCHCGKAAAS